MAECFPAVEDSLPDLGDRAAVRLLLNIREAMQFETPDVTGVVILGSAALHLMRMHVPHFSTQGEK